MYNLANFDGFDQIKNEIKINDDGKGTASIRGTARLAGVDDESVRKAVNSAASSPSKLSITLIEQGFSAADQILWKVEGIPDLAVAAIVHYYAYEAGRYCNDQAKLICKAFNAIGVRAWMQKLTGWVKSDQPENKPNVTVLPPIEQRVSTFVDAADKYNRLFGFNPTIEQAFKDSIGNMLIESNQAALSPAKEDWRGVVSVAEELGHKVPNRGVYCRAFLGKWIREFAPELSDVQDKRLCNETQQNIWVYPLHIDGVKESLEEHIKTFFGNADPGKVLKLAGAFKKKCNPS